MLHNRVNNKELKEKMLAETEKRITVSFYKYFNIADTVNYRNNLYLALTKINVFGRIYIANEGINGQISVPESKLQDFKEVLYNSAPELNGIRLNIAIDDDGKSFWVLRAKIRAKIVADGITDSNFDPSVTGKYLSAKDYNELSEKPDTIIIDMRNHYEYEVGHFENAQEVPSDTFRDQLPMAIDMLKEDKNKNIIMYCTGGIRCEKASAYMLHNGFKNVFHLEGGIIEYTRQAKEQGLPIKFKGKNFVFDERLGERITEDILSECHICGKPCDTHTNCKNDGCHLLFIQCEECAILLEGCCSTDCMEEKNMPSDLQKEKRAGRNNGAMIFNKSKEHPLRKHRDEWKINRV